MTDGSEGKDLSLWIMISLIIIVNIYITSIYISLRLSFRKNRTNQANIILRSYPCYLNIILSMLIFINNLTRLITTKDENSDACKVQAFILACFDKLIGTTLTVNAFLTYKGLCDNSFYIENIKLIFIISNLIGFVISFVFALIMTLRGTTFWIICYVQGGSPKEIPDTIITGVLFAIYLYCTLKSILFLATNIKELSLEKENHRTFSFHYYRMIISMILCSFFYIITILIINDSLFFDYDYVDITFICLCFIIDLFFTLNLTVIKQTLRCCKKEKENEYDDFEDDNEEEDNNYSSNKQLKHLENF